MFPALALAIALNVLQPADTPPARPAPPPVDEATPVAVPPATPTALRYYTSGNRLWVLDQVVSIVLLAAILFSGLSARLRTCGPADRAQLVLHDRCLLRAVHDRHLVITLPLTYYEEFVRQHDYGLSNQTLQKWWTDSLTALASPASPAGCSCGCRICCCARARGDGGSTPPRPRFPSSSSPISSRRSGSRRSSTSSSRCTTRRWRRRILALADRAGIEGSRVFEVNKSVDTKTLNAYVAGLWQTKRIVLWDTIIARMDDRELLFVMGHEMGHYVLGHVWQVVALSSLLILVLLYAAYKTMGAIVARWAHRFGFSDLADVASLPLLLLVTSVFSLVIAPAQLALTRHLEHEADRFGLEITQTNHSAGTAFVKLQEDALGNPWPGPLFKLWRAESSAARRAHRVQQRLSPVARGRAAALRGPVQELTSQRVPTLGIRGSGLGARDSRSALARLRSPTGRASYGEAAP